jgi:hypothetical protein
MDRLWSCSSICILSLIACEGSGNKPVDAKSGGGNDSGGSNGGSASCTASASYGAASIVADGSAYANSAAQIAADGSAGFVDANQGYYGNINADPQPDEFEIDLYEDLGAFMTGSGDITTGTFTLSGADLSYENCGLCLEIYTNLATDGSPTDLYFATGGMVDLTSVGTPTGSDISTGTLSGSISNVTFAHWDGSADAAVGDCNAMITSLSFTGTLGPVGDGFEGGPARIVGRRTR